MLECVDKVVEDEVGAAWAVVRPPGHHAEVRIKKLLYNLFVASSSARLTLAEASV